MRSAHAPGSQPHSALGAAQSFAAAGGSCPARPARSGVPGCPGQQQGPCASPAHSPEHSLPLGHRARRPGGRGSWPGERRSCTTGPWEARQPGSCAAPDPGGRAGGERQGQLRGRQGLAHRGACGGAAMHRARAAEEDQAAGAGGGCCARGQHRLACPQRCAAALLPLPARSARLWHP